LFIFIFISSCSSIDTFPPSLSLQAIYYLLLQDRIDEAKKIFQSIDMKQTTEEAKKYGKVLLEYYFLYIAIKTICLYNFIIDLLLFLLFYFVGAEIECQLQYDYFLAYFDFFNPSPSIALSIAKKYSNYPIVKKRKLFNEIETQIIETFVKNNEIFENDGKDMNRERQMNNLANNEPTLDFNIVQNAIEINYTNVSTIKINFYVSKTIRFDICFMLSS
jgi:hypothetical protein